MNRLRQIIVEIGKFLIVVGVAGLIVVPFLLIAVLPMMLVFMLHSYFGLISESTIGFWILSSLAFGCIAAILAVGILEGIAVQKSRQSSGDESNVEEAPTCGRVKVLPEQPDDVRRARGKK